MTGSEDEVETTIAEWRALVSREPGIEPADVDELEAHLRDQVADLASGGLAPDEALLIALKRMGRVGPLADEYAREHGARLWRQLLPAGRPEDGDAGNGDRIVELLGFAVAAAVTVQVARLVAGFDDDAPVWLLRNASLLVLPFLAAYLARRRRLPPLGWLVTATPFVAAAVLVNAYPYRSGSSTEVLVALHLPVALWFAIAYPYTGGRLRSHERRMDAVRFTGEWLVYYALIALGGGVLTGLALAILVPVGIPPEGITGWVLPSGAAGAVLVSAWLVEAKQRVIENMAPVLTAVFTPLFAIMLTIAAVSYAVTGLGGAFERELVAVFDVLMVVVLGLVLYGLSARDASRPPGWMDRIQLVAVVAALLLDLMVLGAMLARVGSLGLTPNRVAALGLNLVLLVDLAGHAWLSWRFLTGRGALHRLERWQTSYLPVFAVWTAAVVVLLPPAFGFR